MAQIQGRVFDSSVYAWVADVVVALTTSSYASKTYVDGSLALRDASIEVLFNENDIQDASILYNYYRNILNTDDITTLDASIVRIDASINELWDYEAIQDASIISALDPSIKWVQDSCVGSPFLKLIEKIDNGVVYIKPILKSSTKSGYGYATLESVPGSGTGYEYFSIQSNAYSKTATDASLNLKANIIYVDGSLGLRDVSINWLNINKLGTDSSISRLSDVSLGSIGAAQDGSALVYTSSGDYWTYGVAGGGGSDASLNELYAYDVIQDASISTNATNIGDASTRIYENATNIGDASTRIYGNTTNISANDVSIAWLDTNKLGIDASLSDLSDVSTGGIADGDLITSASDYFIPITPIDISTLTLDASEYFVQKTSRAYGQIIIHDASLVQNIPTGATYTPLGPWTQHQGFNYNVEDDPSSLTFFLVPQRTGKYMVNSQISYATDTNAMTSKFVIFQDEAECNWIHNADYLAVGANELHSVSMTGIIDVSTLDCSIGVRVKHGDGGTVEYTIYYANTNIHRIGE